MESTGDKNIDLLNQLIYKPLSGNIEKGHTNNEVKMRLARFYSYIVDKFPVIMILKSSLLATKYDSVVFEHDVQDLNHQKNIQILGVNANESKFIDPNHLQKLYNVVNLYDPKLFNLALANSKDTLQKTGKLNYKNIVSFQHDSHYKILPFSQNSLYLDPTQIFELLNKYKDVFQLDLIQVNKSCLDTKILKSNEPQDLSYESLLNYAKSHHRPTKDDTQNDNNYLQLFTKFGELGFVKSKQSDDYIYLSRH